MGMLSVCCIGFPLACLCPNLLMNASIEGHADIFKILTIMNRALVHHLMIVFLSQFCKPVV